MSRVNWVLVIVAVFALSALGVAIYALRIASAPAPTPEVVRAQRFEVVNPRGEVCAELVVWGNRTPSLRLRDKTGKERAGLRLNRDGTPQLLLRDKDGKVIWSAP